MRTGIIATLAAGFVLAAGVAWANTQTTAVINFTVTFANGANLSVSAAGPLGPQDFDAMADYLRKQAVALTPTPVPPPVPPKP